MKWTQQMDALLIEMHGEGKGGSEIASALCHAGFPVTRNAVCGRTDRLIRAGKLVGNGRGQGEHVRNHPWRKAESKAPSFPAPAPPVASLQPAPQVAAADIAPTVAPAAPEIGVRLLDLGPYKPHAEKCRWPLGDVMAKATHFCGRRPVEGLVYCLTHALRAYEGTTRRAR